MGAKSPADHPVTYCEPKYCDGYRDHSWIKPEQEKDFLAAEDHHTKLHWALKLNKFKPRGYK